MTLIMVWPRFRLIKISPIHIKFRTTCSFSTLPVSSECKDLGVTKKLIYSSKLSEDARQKRIQGIRKAAKEWRNRHKRIEEFIPSVSLKYLTGDEEVPIPLSVDEDQIASSSKTVMPLALKVVPSSAINTEHLEKIQSDEDSPFLRDSLQDGSTVSLKKRFSNDYSHVTHQLEDVNPNDYDWVTNYGTNNPEIPSSKVPCGGCGAHLHCKDSSIPGFIPQELFSECKASDLRSLMCQRCYFLQHHNTALSAAVDPGIYPRIISQIKTRKALVLLAVDMTDFPGSIWPEITGLVGLNSPLFLVGNKVDLLWGDGKGWLNRVEKNLKSQFPHRANIIGTQLISAKTGFGVEDLISKLHESWNCQGDVYLVGCTNVGKSTLFNALLQSDYCKSKAVNLVHRATTAPWPGTTINLLKFPIIRTEGWRTYLRSIRLRQDLTAKVENNLKQQQISGKDPDKKMPPQLIGHIGRTFHNSLGSEENDVFSSPDYSHPSKEPIPGAGLNPNDPDFVKGRWFYDTPGVLHNNQILDLLTTDELMKVLPRRVIEPQTIIMKPGWTLFIAGVARVDYLEGLPHSMKWTVFVSRELPITICFTEDADEVYNKLLDSDAFVVPQSDANRLKQWPQLKFKGVYKFAGVSKRESCGDLVLASCGWISFTPPYKEIISIKPWTPLGRGIFTRSPALLPFAVNLRGVLKKGTPVYSRSRPFDGSCTLNSKN